MYLLAKPVSKVNKPIKIFPVLPPQKDDLNPKIFLSTNIVVYKFRFNDNKSGSKMAEYEKKWFYLKCGLC